jgi:hypothetical protein
VIAKPARAADARKPKILIPDASPLSLLGTVPGALDWIFVPKCEVWIPDIVADEILRDPGAGNDSRIEHRAEIAGWLTRNKYRIKRMKTRIGERYRTESNEYARACKVWELAGRPKGMQPKRPAWRDRGDESVWIAVRTANASIDTIASSTIALVDDGELRDAIEVKGRRLQAAAIDLMGTQTFIRWMAEDFAIEEAATAWETIAAARQNKVPPASGGQGVADPVYIRVAPPRRRPRSEPSR